MSIFSEFDPNCQGITFQFTINGDIAREYFDDAFSNIDERDKYIDRWHEGEREMFFKIKRDISRLQYNSVTDEYISQTLLFRTDLCSDYWDLLEFSDTIRLQILSHLKCTDISQHVPWTGIMGAMSTDLYNSQVSILPKQIKHIIESENNIGNEDYFENHNDSDNEYPENSNDFDEPNDSDDSIDSVE